MAKTTETYIHAISLGILFIALSIGVFLFYLSVGNPARQYNLILACSTVYFLWGVIYHLMKGDFHVKVVVEYLLIALLAVLLLRGALFH